MDSNNLNMILDTDEFLALLSEKIKNNSSVNLTATGNSMAPFLAHKRDTAILSRFSGNVKKGDVLFYRRENGKCVLHRVYKNENGNIYFIGDSQNYVEGPLSVDCILAECNSVIRKGKLIDQKSLFWMFFRYIWIRIVPLRQRIMKIVGKIKNNQ